MQIYQFLCKELSVTRPQIKGFLISAPKRYKVYSIPKRTSGRRIIAHPAKYLKKCQRALVKLLEQYLKIHDAAYAYKKNTGIKQNAIQHQKSKYLLKMDFQNFFYSITPNLFFQIMEQMNIDIIEEEKKLLTQVLFWSPGKISGGKLILSVGAPSSPLISNAIMYYFDNEIDEICRKKNITYTRYADDITFSTKIKNNLFDIPDLVRRLLVDNFSGQITINEGKTVFSSKAHNRHVTGVTITNNETLSIGRERKRYISSLIHKFSLNQLPAEDINYLQGLLAFACDIEPEFKNRMIRKYSLKTLNQVMARLR
ncbi:Retron-type RNA-directed DNA polymerase [hydrothermal vent metagenome]|uniref:Retron-type RNA-directed DNA polymerase n=1 Tax=hydrothermal vent metagenome TaxID=652676 RepID=A0A3B0XXP5_9ZZZZ